MTQSAFPMPQQAPVVAQPFLPFPPQPYVQPAQNPAPVAPQQAPQQQAPQPPVSQVYQQAPAPQQSQQPTVAPALQPAPTYGQNYQPQAAPVQPVHPAALLGAPQQPYGAEAAGGATPPLGAPTAPAPTAPPSQPAPVGAQPQPSATPSSPAAPQLVLGTPAVSNPAPTTLESIAGHSVEWIADHWKDVAPMLATAQLG